MNNQIDISVLCLLVDYIDPQFIISRYSHLIFDKHALHVLTTHCTLQLLSIESETDYERSLISQSDHALGADFPANQLQL